MNQKELLQSQVNVLDSFVGILQEVIDSDKINHELYNDMLSKMDRAKTCYIEVNALEL